MAFEPWPAADLEDVLACPYCGGQQRSLALEGVEDWAFGSAPGRWNFWDCHDCHALYLHPRPTPESIGRAYTHYYTHGGTSRASIATVIKQRLRHEYWSHTWQVSIAPRIGLPRWAGWTLAWLKTRIAEPFGLRQWAQRPKGLLIDVGCGNGDKLKLAGQMGWRTLGIELDGAAAQAAQAQGLNVQQGGYELLENYRAQADCIVCSHVLEHVHQPLQLLQLLMDALAPQGVLLLSAPNAASSLRQVYRENWRGLEAPRHLAIPDAAWLAQWLRAQGMACEQVPAHAMETAIESERIARRGHASGPQDIAAARRRMPGQADASLAQQDVVQLVCIKTPSTLQRASVNA